jgi:hypothetical protein
LPTETRSIYTYCNGGRQKPVTTTPYSTLKLHIIGTILYARAPADRYITSNTTYYAPDHTPRRYIPNW